MRVGRVDQQTDGVGGGVKAKSNRIGNLIKLMRIEELVTSLGRSWVCAACHLQHTLWQLLTVQLLPAIFHTDPLSTNVKVVMSAVGKTWFKLAVTEFSALQAVSIIIKVSSPWHPYCILLNK